MRHSPVLLLVGAGLLVGVPYVLIRAGEALAAEKIELEPPARSVPTPATKPSPPAGTDSSAAEELPAPSGLVAEVSLHSSADASKSTETPLPRARLSDQEFAGLALATDASSLDQDFGMNADFREHGVGLVPRILSVNAEEKSARLVAAAVGLVFRLPFGWYATDDGQRTLVFDDDGRIQISLKLRRTSRSSPAEVARGLAQQLVQRQAGLAVHTLEFEGDIAGASVHGVEIDGETLDQVFLVRPADRPGYMLVARISAKGEHRRRALSLAGDILAGSDPGRDLMAQN